MNSRSYIYLDWSHWNMVFMICNDVGGRGDSCYSIRERAIETVWAKTPDTGTKITHCVGENWLFKAFGIGKVKATTNFLEGKYQEYKENALPYWVRESYNLRQNRSILTNLIGKKSVWPLRRSSDRFIFSSPQSQNDSINWSCSLELNLLKWPPIAHTGFKPWDSFSFSTLFSGLFGLAISSKSERMKESQFSKLSGYFFGSFFFPQSKGLCHGLQMMGFFLKTRCAQ